MKRERIVQPTEQQKHDLGWLYSTEEGLTWVFDQCPKPRPLPTDAREHAVIVRRLSPLTRGATPPVGQMIMPRRPNRNDDNWGWLQVTWLWYMPWRYTAYMSDLNAYWHWYQNLRPGWHTETLAEALDDKTVPMYQICKAIANERRAVRLGKQ